MSRITPNVSQFFPVKFDINDRVLIGNSEKAITFVTENCPYGPVNFGNAILAKRKYYALRDDETNEPYTSSELEGLPAVVAFSLLSQHTNYFEVIEQQPIFDQITLLTKLSLLFGTGTCVEFSYIAFSYLALQENISQLQIITIRNERESHTVVAIGDMSSCYRPEEVIICDPWLKLVFRLSEWNDYCLDEHRITDESELNIFYRSDELDQNKKTIIQSCVMSRTTSEHRSQVDASVAAELERWKKPSLRC